MDTLTHAPADRGSRTLATRADWLHAKHENQWRSALFLLREKERNQSVSLFHDLPRITRGNV